ncbi:unnamed protein product [Brassicogethes aeneus]|uniref:Uncharacterized protein n=1 Tax=Brassicogethes aeneus TaxID=1431903 RepID=A0A9P0AWA6_BRAAE|nr:unnamed protein product [Brassicogethes aeneus]
MRLNLKINSDKDLDRETKETLIKQNDVTAVTVLISNCNSELRTLLMLSKPKNIEEATSLVINHSLYEQQINIRYQQQKPIQKPISVNRNSNNPNFYKPVQQNPNFYFPVNSNNNFPQRNNFNNTNYQRQQQFPSQPIKIEPRPIQQKFFSNAEVFGKPTNVFSAKNSHKPQNKPEPMSTISRIPSLKNNPPQRLNYFQNKIILFKIHIPIVSSQFKLFRLYPIPIKNKTIIPEQPYLLLNTRDFWTTSQQCPEIENWYFCRQNDLHKHQPCLADLIRNGKILCQSTNIHYSETSVTQINSKDVLIIPARNTKIESSCDIEGIYETSKPSILSMKKCKISINGKFFQAEDTNHEEFIFELPKIELPHIEINSTNKSFYLKQITSEDIDHINRIANNLQIPDLSSSSSTSHPWINTFLFIMAVLRHLVLH